MHAEPVPAATIMLLRDAQDAIESSPKRKVVPVLPAVAGDGKERKLVIPADAGYPTTEEKLELPGR